MPELNWKAAATETAANLARLIQCDTTNPPGNERPAILAIKDILECEGIPPEEIKILEPAPNRMSLVARLRGDGSQRPLLLTGHVDVVPVEDERLPISFIESGLPTLWEVVTEFCASEPG
jgi:acetylornithine deacetylase/succinyl-diaminopimelate desuccinylase-like protein